MNNKDVAKAWWNCQDANECRRGSNFYYEGDTIYSYGSHFPIAVRHRGYTLCTTRGYSNSTARHMSYVRQVMTGTVFYVDNVLAETEASHAHNLVGMIEEWDDAVAFARKSRKEELRVMRQAHADKLEEMLDEYARRFVPAKAKPTITGRAVRIREVA